MPGGFGITDLLMKNGAVLRKKKSTWVSNITLNHWPNSKLVMVGRETVKDFLVRIYGLGLVVCDITAFNSNSNLVSVQKLYGKEVASAVLVNVRGAMSLMTIGSKTLEEFQSAGHDSYGKSQVPLLINSNLEPINLYL